MKRRDFVAASALAGMSSITHAVAADKPAVEPEYYELRRYHMLYGSKQKILNDFLGEVAIPAMNRLNIGPVGAFYPVYGTATSTLFVLIPHPTLQSVATLRQRLAEDKTYQKEGAAFLQAPMSDPSHVRIESTLMRAFDALPKLETPLKGRERILELRTYSSHSDAAVISKLKMFNQGGEIPIFRRAGLHPVFFGETLIGDDLPNLTYMIAAENLNARDKGWEKFGKDPDWVKLVADSQYAESVSFMTDQILAPMPYSQI